MFRCSIFEDVFFAANVVCFDQQTHVFASLENKKQIKSSKSINQLLTIYQVVQVALNVESGTLFARSPTVEYVPTI